ncbi:MAG: hypothetical protein NC209_04890 [Alistipes sp.]|nr:hypothetical protein [Alistipes senegalensis]MCM1250462.1 hypothetical protein [Alistipes sp.]
MHELYNLKDTAQCNYIAAKIFAYALTVKNNCWMLDTERPDGEILVQQFQQFRRLLDLEIYRREANLAAESVDLFRPEAYRFGIEEVEPY